MKSFKKKILTIALFFLVLSGYSQESSKIVLISDFDDTYRITNTKSKITAALNAVFTKKVFGGMSLLYEQIDRNAEAFYMLSNSPKKLRRRVKKILWNNNLNPDSICLYEKIGTPYEQKYNFITEMLDKHHDALFILVGDDSGEDPEIYHSIQNNNVGRIAAIYIRPVRGRTVPKGSRIFHTAFDIACYELAASRYQYADAQAVGQKVIGSKKKFIFPSYLSISHRLQIKDIDDKMVTMRNDIYNLMDIAE